MSLGFVYLDSSVALAELFNERVRPPAALWAERLVSSRLLDYECWVQLNARGAGQRHDDSLRALLSRVAKLEIIEPVVSSVREHGSALRTLDALHLASIRFLLDEDQSVQLATYDRRLAAAAEAVGIELYPL